MSVRVLVPMGGALAAEGIKDKNLVEVFANDRQAAWLPPIAVPGMSA